MNGSVEDDNEEGWEEEGKDMGEKIKKEEEERSEPGPVYEIGRAHV